MFKGKILIKKIDPTTGEEYYIEKEFNNPEEYRQFIQSHPEFNLNYFNLGDIDFRNRYLSNLTNLINSFFDATLPYQNTFYYPTIQQEYQFEEEPQEELPVDLSKYKKKIKEIKKKKEEKIKKLKQLEKALKTLKEYKKQFEEAGEKQLLEKIKEDIKKVEEEIKKLKQEKQ